MMSPFRVPPLVGGTIGSAQQFVRGSLGATMATFAALLGHLLGGAAVPGVLQIAAPWLLSLAICIPLAGRRLSLVRLSVSVIASQLVFHHVFTLGTHAAHGAQHAHHGAIGMAPLDERMGFAHLLAATLTVLFLFRGEQTLRQLRELSVRIVGWMRRRLQMPPAPPLVGTRPQTTLATGTRVIVFPEAYRCSISRRGPPAGCPRHAF